jgi:UDP-N-acetylglucosamine--dolichyl-phosphate N-acetylglucosaminephosphotransferase
MMNSETLLTILAYVISFGVAFFLTPQWIRYARQIKLVGKDMHKVGKDEIPEAGGIVIITAMFFSLMYYAGIKLFVFNDTTAMVYIIGSIGSLLCVSIVGVMDDFSGWKIGLKQWQKPLLTLPASIPFILVAHNRSVIDLPFIGLTDVGILFAVILIPMAIVGASNAFNMLAGYNGLETGMGIIILGTFALLSHCNGQSMASVMCLIGVFSLSAFIIFNWFPSRVFPGDTMTYPIGAFLAVCAILGGVEKYALILFIPYFIDFMLPLRKKMKVEAFAKVNGDGSFEPPYEQVYDSTHAAIIILKKWKKKVYERDVVYLILFCEFILAAVCMLLYFFVPFY